MINEVKEIFENEGRVPLISEDFPMVHMRISSGEWSRFGIDSWNDILDKTIGREYRLKHKYEGLEGLNFVISILKEYYENHNEYPRKSSFNHIARLASSGYWTEYGINSWWDIFDALFGRENRIVYKYTPDQEDLDVAISEMSEYFNETGEYPIITDAGMGGIAGAIDRGAWKSLGINTWLNLFDLVFGRENRRSNRYLDDEIGLNMAIEELIKFYKSEGRYPKADEMRHISDKALYGSWTKFGIDK